MRTFLLTIFWMTNLSSVIQLLVMASAGWIIFSGAYSFFDLTVNVFVVHYVPWLNCLRTLIIELFGDFGYWILSIPILIITPLKLLTGIFIGVWAYTTAKNMDADPA